MNQNKMLKALIKSKKILLWQVAEKLGMQDSNFSRMLRHELNFNELQKVHAAIDELEKEKNNNGKGT